jgi:nitroimidazol reductase NimA-like FMN-containing flavoprotein (pyridoxamine 5'-phosphate oxidase superfamily)
LSFQGWIYYCAKFIAPQKNSILFFATFATINEKSMRRKDREIIYVEDKIKIISECKVCRLGLSQNNQPYIIPLNYGYSFDGHVLTLYFHSANEGEKLDIIRNNHNACFEMDCHHKLIEVEKACNYGYTFKSVIGFGKIIFMETNDEKNNGLNQIMKHQTGKDTRYSFDIDALKNVTVYKLLVEEFTGKERPVVL